MTATLLLPLLILAAGVLVVGLVLLARWAESQSWRRSLLAFRLRLPAGISLEGVTRWLATVNAAMPVSRFALLNPPPVVLEVVGSPKGIEHIVVVPASLRDSTLSGIRASLPGVRVEPLPDYFNIRSTFTVASEVTLTSQYRPLSIERAEIASSALLAALQPLHGAEHIVMQWIVMGGGASYPVASLAAGRSQDHGWFFDGRVSVDSEAVRAARLKQKEPLLRASLRIGVLAPNRARAYSLHRRISAALRIMDAPGVGVVHRWWQPARLVGERLRAVALPLVVWPLTLNIRELAGLIGFPISDVQLPGLSLGAARQLPPARNIPTHGAVVGMSNYPGSERRVVALRPDDRLRHTWVVGPTGTGKSTLLGNLIMQDIAAGSGVVVIDPRGDLVADVLARIPDVRRDDVIVLDPSQTARPLGFNVLSGGGGERSRELAVDHVLHVFQDLYRSSWGPRTADILRTSLLTLMVTRAPDGSAFTLVELPELLTNDRFRSFVVRQVGVQQHHAELRSFWRWYNGLSDAERGQIIGPVLNKLRAFVLKSPLRLLLGQSEGLDLNSVFSQRKVLLVPLSKGTLGSETTQLIGSLLMASIWQLALGRVNVAPERRRPVWLYADEFQETVRLPIDLADMLAQARGLGLGLTLAHQHLGQLPEALKTAVLSTARTQVAFQLDYDDATSLARSFTPLTRGDLMGLERYEVALRPCVEGRTLSPVTVTTLPLPEPTTDAINLAEFSRQRYGVDRREVEARLTARISVGTKHSETGRQRHGDSL